MPHSHFPLSAFALALGLMLPAQGHATPPETIVTASVLEGWQTAKGGTMMALRLSLTPGWKTYWRSPGDAGIPPVFDWSGSENLGQVRIHWPRPSVFQTNGMTSIGYHDELILPIEIFPADPGRAVRAALRLDLGVCEEICVPASVVLDWPVAAGGADSKAIKVALAALPASAKAAGLSAIRCEVTPLSDGLRVTAHLDLPALGPAETVVFEAGMPDVWVSAAETGRQGGTLSAASDMVGTSGAPFALDRSGVTLTVIAGAEAVEIRGCPSGE